jgi:hypothetical protein
MNTSQNAESAGTEKSPETVLETRVAPSPETSDPPPTPEEQEPDQKNTATKMPQNPESAPAANPERTTQSSSAGSPPENPNGPAIPADQEHDQEQEQESGKVNTPAKPEEVALSPVLGALEVLSEAEQADLYACEEVIGTGWHTFVQVGLALARIRDLELYRTEFESFEAYCRAKWEYGRIYVYHLISAAQLFTHLLANCKHRKPDHESQLRPLIGLSPEQAQQAWEYAVEKAGSRKITARLVKTAVQELGLAPQTQSGSAPVRTAKSERRLLISRTMGELLKLISDKAGHELLLEKARALETHLSPLLGKK